MKFKLSWPAGIIIAIVSFVVFILSFVYKVTFLPEYDHHLVSEQYYKDELHYQEEIDKENLAAKLEENIVIKKVADGLLITFPSEFDSTQITGTISFQRLSNGNLDFELPIDLKSSELLILDEDLVSGVWNIKIEWTTNNKTYLLKEKLMY